MLTVWLSVALASAPFAVTGDPARLRQALALEATDETSALASLEALVKASPTWELPRLEAARLRLKRGETLSLVEAHLEAARSYAPENPRAHFLWGMLMEEQKRPLAAIAAYQIALVLRPDYAEAQFRAGGIYFALGDFASAVGAYRVFLAAHPEAVGARLQLAAAAERAGHPKVAEKELRALFKVPSARVLAGRRLAEYYERTGNPGAAAKVRAAFELPARKLRELKPSGR